MFVEGLLAYDLEAEAKGWVLPVYAPPEVVHVLRELVVQDKSHLVKLCRKWAMIKCQLIISRRYCAYRLEVLKLKVLENIKHQLSRHIVERNCCWRASNSVSYERRGALWCC